MFDFNKSLKSKQRVIISYTIKSSTVTTHCFPSLVSFNMYFVTCIWRRDSVQRLNSEQFLFVRKNAGDQQTRQIIRLGLSPCFLTIQDCKENALHNFVPNRTATWPPTSRASANKLSSNKQATTGYFTFVLSSFQSVHSYLGLDPTALDPSGRVLPAIITPLKIKQKLNRKKAEMQHRSCLLLAQT